MKKYGRVDANQKEIVSYLRGIPGCKVLLLSSVGSGCPDFCVGWMGVNYLIELKDGSKPPSQRKLTADEKKFHEQWPGQVAVCNNLNECLTTIGIDIYDPSEIPF